MRHFIASKLNGDNRASRLTSKDFEKIVTLLTAIAQLYIDLHFCFYDDLVRLEHMRAPFQRACFHKRVFRLPNFETLFGVTIRLSLADQVLVRQEFNSMYHAIRPVWIRRGKLFTLEELGQTESKHFPKYKQNEVLLQLDEKHQSIASKMPDLCEKDGMAVLELHPLPPSKAHCYHIRENEEWASVALRECSTMSEGTMSLLLCARILSCIEVF